MHKQQTHQLPFLRHLPYNSTRNIVETKTIQNSCHLLACHNAMKPTLLASMAPFLPELSVRGEAAPKQTNKASNCTRLHKVLITSHPSDPTKKPSPSFFAPHTTPNLCPKQITSTKKLVTEIPALALLVALPHKKTWQFEKNQSTTVTQKHSLKLLLR